MIPCLISKLIWRPLAARANLAETESIQGPNHVCVSTATARGFRDAAFRSQKDADRTIDGVAKEDMVRRGWIVWTDDRESIEMFVCGTRKGPESQKI